MLERLGSSARLVAGGHSLLPMMKLRLANFEYLIDINPLHDELGYIRVLPDEVRYLFKVAAIKAFCRQANVEKIDAGPKGAVISFRDNTFPNPERLVAFIHDQGRGARDVRRQCGRAPVRRRRPR